MARDAVKVGQPTVVDLQTIQTVAANLRRVYPLLTSEEREAIVRAGIAQSPGFAAEPGPSSLPEGNVGRYQDAVLRHGAVPADIARRLQRMKERAAGSNFRGQPAASPDPTGAIQDVLAGRAAPQGSTISRPAGAPRVA